METPFTYPFCYTPTAEVQQAAARLFSLIESLDDEVKAAFAEGKMMGVLIAEDPADGARRPLFAFSGNAAGRSCIPGFVPPIYDLADPQGTYRQREAQISEINRTLEKLKLSAGEGVSTEIERLSHLRHASSVELQDWIFNQYIVHNALGEELSIKEVFALRGLIPPGGTGDCAAPKLLEAAFRQGLKPIAMGELWYGASPTREVRMHGAFYPSCTGKCGPLLTWMMRGLDVEPNPLDAPFTYEGEPEVVYEDEYLIVANKPSGMLSVPGRTEKVSLQDILSERCGQSVTSCHRLDMDTAGLIVYAKSIEVQASVQAQFQDRSVRKTYRALLSPANNSIRAHATKPAARRLTVGAKGTIALPLMLDYYDRPRQMVDFEQGKQAITEYEVLRVDPSGEIEVRFTPKTGRTHQLRVHSAHPQGLGHPIKGDRLYGGGPGKLHLLADSLAFSHPVTGERMKFSL